jgi:hypothetical protein
MLKAQTDQATASLAAQSRKQAADQADAVAADQHVQNTARADQLHELAVREGNAKAALAEKRLKESSFKPKPKSGGK